MLKDRIEQLIDSLEGVAGIIVKNDSTGEMIYRHNPNMIFPAASIIKLPILWTLFKAVESGKVKLSDAVHLSSLQRIGGFGILKDLSDGTTVTVVDCAMLMIILSDNIATNYLIQSLGMGTINTVARDDLGMREASLQREMMDSEAKKRGLDNYISPTDVLKFFDALTSSNLLTDESRKKMRNILIGQQCNNKLPADIEDEVIFAHKTGDLPKTEHDAGIMFLKDAITVVVMLKDLKSNADGIAFHNALGQMIFEEYK
jgi:beta-lactamase class A